MNNGETGVDCGGGGCPDCIDPGNGGGGGFAWTPEVLFVTSDACVGDEQSLAFCPVRRM
jgi:hypothetical protein